MKIICIDFDGVIRMETDEMLTPLDRIYPGAIEFIKSMKEQGNIVIVFTARDIVDTAHFISSKEKSFIFDVFGQIPDFFMEKIKSNLSKPGVIGVTNVKYPADIYIDDRAYRFEGDWEKSSKQIEKLLK